MTNPFEPPVKKAFNDAELALEIEQAKDAIAAMEILESQARLRAEDAQNYVAWVRQMEAIGTAESKSSLNAARRAQAGLPTTSELPEEESRDDSSWQNLIPDWQERQVAQLRATEDAVEKAQADAEAKFAAEREAAIAAAVAQAQAEAEIARAEVIDRIRREAAEKLQAELVAAEEAARLEAERDSELKRIQAEQIAEDNRIEAERIAEVQRVEAERRAVLQQEAEAAKAEVERNNEIAQQEAMRIAEETRIEAERLAQLEREEASREAELIQVQEEPTPVSAADYATGSFDIIESAEQSADESEDDFDYLLTGGELPFAREPKSGAIDKPLSTISRRSKAISQLFIWGGLTVGVGPLALGAYVSHLPNAGDGILAIAFGLLFSATLISVAAIAGKRSGLSTLLLARAAFGVHGNLVSAIPLVLIKLVFGAAVLFTGISFFDGTISGLPALNQAISSALPAISWQAAGLAAILFFGGTLAFFGGKVLYWAQLITAGIGAIAVLIFISVTAGDLNFEVLVFSATPDFFALAASSSVVGIFFGAFWITAVAEFTRKIPMRESGTKVSLFVALASGVLPLLIASYALVAFKSVFTQGRIDSISSPLDEVLKATPEWAANALLYSAVLTLLIWASSWMYATSVSFAAIGIKVRPALSQPVILLLTISFAIFVSQYVNSDFVAVVVLSWSGIFAGDVAIRRIAYHEVSLAREYGFYKAWNWLNITGFLLAIAVGLGLVSSGEMPWSWLGYISDSYGNIGIYVSPLVAFLFPILFGRKRIKNQESEVLKIEARRHDLADVETE